MKRLFATILTVLLCISLVACGDSSEHIGEAKTPSGSSVQQGRNYLDVIDDFQERGFTNIETEAIDDLIFGWLTEDGEVEKVTVDGDEDYPFLREIMPEYAVISVGKDNSYDHPTDNTLSRLRDADVTILRTDLHGDIVFTSDGKTVTVSTDKSASEEDVMTPGGSIIIPSTTVTPDPEPEQSTDTQPSGTDYVVNTNTGKFHYPSCSSVKKMKESNKMFYTGTRDDLVSQGYSPCGNCHP